MNAGLLIKSARKAKGLTQKQLADQLNDVSGWQTCTVNHVYRWETGRRSPREWMPHLMTVLGLRLEQGNTSTACTLVHGSATPGIINPPPSSEDDVDRREFTGATLGALAAVPLAAAAGQAAPPGRRYGVADVDRARRQLSDLRRLDDYTGGASTYPIALREMTRVDEMLRGSYSDRVGTDLLSVLAEFGQFTAWTAFDAGKLEDARRHALRATAAANQAGNRLLAASTLSELAYITASSSTPGESVAMARASWANAPRDALPAARVVLADRMAFACARTGDARGVDHAISLAEDAHDHRDDHAEPEPDWLYWINRDESRIMVGRCWAELHRPVQAIPVLETVTAPYDDTHAREVAMLECWLADSYLDAGEIDRAAASTSRAVELAERTASPRTDRWVNGLLQRLAGHRDVAPVREVLERTATI
ncbi:helix-turn-helix domain protein [Streptantibioticus cattleyicolor NRRL 8057 = DSM 46488]|uniref:Helix-turn-helix domain protein n=1 Tax=Streptantibioticus cattleyicolor (strain ATCC 35852 / DSM 46488 / JCM 4925 / NBRC 14057 / NRRL 8057) TaxID=1003195 RepID=G8WP79_STREN|nr:helix-turn-helix domain protein [Streptantibioticus cattleyicolor NRRL 8057 = DSM 46488]MYS59219.1 helix-turn-helix domain-containing protein [Streptomyces sp. SID5468]